MRYLRLTLSHLGVGAIGFAMGVYFLPILIEPEAPNIASVEEVQTTGPQFTARFDRKRADSDAFHWGDGEIRFYKDTIVFEGELSPGPDYRLYLTPQYIETEEAFLKIKEQSAQVGSIKTFEAFVLENIAEINDPKFNSVVIWCERFSQFITSAKFR
jgi:hypothetical protein